MGRCALALGVLTGQCLRYLPVLQGEGRMGSHISVLVGHSAPVTFVDFSPTLPSKCPWFQQGSLHGRVPATTLDSTQFTVQPPLHFGVQHLHLVGKSA